MTWAAETPSDSASRRSGSPIAIAGCAIIRASCPPPWMTARVGAYWHGARLATPAGGAGGHPSLRWFSVSNRRP